MRAYGAHAATHRDNLACALDQDLCQWWSWTAFKGSGRGGILDKGQAGSVEPTLNHHVRELLGPAGIKPARTSLKLEE